MSWDFVGRAGEVGVLEAAWLTAAAGATAPVVVVSGEPGIGKTRVVTEFGRLVRERGGEVLWGACHEWGGARPYAVWAEAVQRWAEGLGSEGLQAVLGSDVRWLAPLLADIAGVDSGAVSVPAEVARFRLAETLVRVLDSFARLPVVVLDDMHWAYPESLELLGQVARLASRALLVVCCRGTALDLGHPLAQRLAQVQRERGCEYVSLGSLAREEARVLLEQAAGGPLAERLVDAVYEESGGNPFFLGELGRHLHRDGAAGGVRGLPQSVRAAVGLRLAGLSAQTRHVLQLASVFRAGFGFAELQALTELEEGPLLDCLEQALGEELVWPLEGERYDFAHALVRQTLYERLSPSRRARLHRRLAEALERLHEQDPARIAGELVRQYHASATLPGADRGVVHALTVARAERAAGAPADAVMMLRLGLDLVAAGDTETRARVLCELAQAEAEAGMVDDAPRTLAAAVSLLEDAGAPGEAIAELVYAVGVAFVFAVAPQSLHEIEPLIARGLAAVGQRQSLAWARLKLLERSARPQTVGRLPVLRPVRFHEEAVQIARIEGTEADYAFTIDPFDPSLETELDELIARVGTWRDLTARLRVLAIVVGRVTLSERGSSPAADGLSTEFRELADDRGLVPDRALARVYRAAVLGARGEFDAAAEHIAQAGALFERQSGAGVVPAVVTIVGELIAQHVAPDWPRLGARLWDLARRPEDAGWYGATLAAFAAYAFACAGEVDRAREILGDILAQLESADLSDSQTNGLAAGAVWELRAADLAERLLPHAQRLSDADAREGYMGSRELTVARLSALAGRFDHALEYFGRARTTLERRDQRVLRAIVDYDEALARLSHGRPGAAALLAQASARFEQLGMSEWSRRAALAQADRGLPDGLTAREAEILRLVAARRTNKEIAAELVISVHTVERHVQNAYRKIGASNRAGATDYVARVGL